MYPAMHWWMKLLMISVRKVKKNHFEHFVINKPLRPVPTECIAEQAEQNDELSPREVTEDAPLDPIKSEMSEDAPAKGYN